MAEQVVGLDIGGTKLLVAAADARGTVLRRVRMPTPRGLAEGLDALHAMVAAVSEGRPIAAIGASIGGPLDIASGVVSPLHQPEWRNVPLRAIMEERWRCPLRVDVDTNLAALAEYHFGGERAARLLYLTLSTGMGGGFLVDGRIYRGAGGAHPEAGHIAVVAPGAEPAGLSCECGAPDCLEGLVSGNGIRRRYGKAPEQLSESEWDTVAGHFGQGLRNLAALYCPGVIVVGGGLAVGAGDRLLRRATEVMRARLKIVPAPDVRLSRLGQDTALLGSIAAALHGVE